MAQQFSVLLLGAILATITVLVSSHPLESDYRKYLRTRPPQAPGEVHVEEVLEVFRTRERPPTYGVYNAGVNAFLANSAHRRRKVPPVVRPLPTPTTTTTTTVRSILVTRTTFPTPTRDNVNPDYTNPFQPSISMTKYPSYRAPKTIIIQEGSTGCSGKGTMEGPVTTEKVPDEGEQLGEDDTYSYSNEEYFDQ